MKILSAFNFLLISLSLFSINFYAQSADIQESFSKAIDIDNGRKIYLQCSGVGSPTVVLISGLDDRGDIWYESDITEEPSVFAKIKTSTRVCVYDRPGTVSYSNRGILKSRSDPINQPTTVQQAAIDLHDVLTTSKQPGPYVLVGHSAGGLIARSYAAMYPEEVDGLVLVDALSEELYDLLSTEDWVFFNDKLNGVPESLSNYKGLERIDFVVSFMQMKPLEHDIPIIVLSAGKFFDIEALKSSGRLVGMPDDFLERLWDSQIKAQNYLANLFPNAKHIWQKNSGHYIQVEQPQVVSQAILKVVKQVRKKEKAS